MKIGFERADPMGAEWIVIGIDRHYGMGSPAQALSQRLGSEDDLSHYFRRPIPGYHQRRIDAWMRWMEKVGYHPVP